MTGVSSSDPGMIPVATPDMTAVAAGAARFLAVESCGQCSPCKLDGENLTERLMKVTESVATEFDMGVIRKRIGTVADRSRCYLATQQQVLLESLLKHFPEDFADPEQAGKEQHLHLKLISVQHKEVPELDDDFARSLGDFEDLTALRARVLEDLREEARRNAEAEVRGQLVAQILEANPFDVPGSMVDRYLDLMTGQSEEERGKLSDEQREQISQWRETLRPQAEEGLKRMMVVERIAEERGLRATQDEIDARVEELALRGGRTPGEVWLQLEKSGQLQALENEVTEEKVFEYLKSQNTVS